jgi:exonuclease VII large subunit
MHARRLHRAMINLVQLGRHRLESIERHEAFRRPRDRVDQLRQFLDERQRTLHTVMDDRLHDLRQRVAVAEQGLATAGNERLRRERDGLSRLVASLSEQHPKHAVSLAATRIDALDARLRTVMKTCLKRQELKVDLLARHLTAIGPEQVLKRGYSITTLKKGGKVVRSVDQVQPGDRLVTRLADGEIESTADDKNQPGLFE